MACALGDDVVGPGIVGDAYIAGPVLQQHPLGRDDIQLIDVVHEGGARSLVPAHVEADVERTLALAEQRAGLGNPCPLQLARADCGTGVQRGQDARIAEAHARHMRRKRQGGGESGEDGEDGGDQKTHAERSAPFPAAGGVVENRSGHN